MEAEQASPQLAASLVIRELESFDLLSATYLNNGIKMLLSCLHGTTDLVGWGCRQQLAGRNPPRLPRFIFPGHDM